MMNQANQNTAKVWAVRRQWPLYLLCLVLLVGTGIGIYLTWHHENEVYGDSSVALASCTETATVNCEVVNSSEYSELLGVPIALLAAVTYLWLFCLVLFRRKNPFYLAVVFAAGLFMTGYSAYLYYVSQFKIGFLCLWCLRLYFVNMSIPVLAGLSLGRNPFALMVSFMDSLSGQKRAIRIAGIGFLAGLAVAVGGQRGYRATLSRLPGHVEAFKKSGKVYPGEKLVGSCAPAIQLKSLNGKEVSFNGRSANGKPTLIFFWSATCKHCQKEIPLLMDHAKRNPGQYNVITVTHIRPDRNGVSHRQITEDYVKATGFAWSVLVDWGVVSEAYRVVSTPTTYLVGANGTVEAGWFGAHSDLDAAFGQAFRNLASDSSKSCRELAGPVRPKLEFSVLDSVGKSVSLASFRGKPTLVHLWATWCGPCEEEMPSLLSYSSEFEKRGGQVAMVSVEEADDGGKITKFLKRMKTSRKSYRAPHGQLADDMNVGYSVPRTYLLSAEGEILQTYYGVQKWSDPSFKDKIAAWAFKK